MTQTQSASKLFAINAISSILAKILQITVLVWVNQFLIATIPPAEYAIYPVIISLMLSGEIFTKIFTGGISRYVVEKDAKRDFYGITSVVSSMVPFLCLAVLVVSILGGIAVWQIQPLINVSTEYINDARIMLGILVVTLLMNILFSPFSNGLYVKQKFIILSAIELSCEIIKILVLLVLLFGISPKVLWVVVASSAVLNLNLAIKILYTRKLLPSAKFDRKSVDWALARRMIRFGMWTSTSGVTNIINRTIPFMLLSHFGTAIHVAIFNLGVLVEINIRKILQSATIPLQPALTKYYATEGKDKLSVLYYIGGRYHLWILLFAAPPLIVFRYDIITLYVGETYKSAGDVMMFFFLAYPFNFTGAMYYRIAHALGDVGGYFRLEMILSLAFLICSIFTVVSLDQGAIGIAFSYFFISLLINPLLMWPAGLKLINGNWQKLILEILLPGIIPFLISIAVTFGVQQLFEFKSWLGIALGSLISLIVYSIVTYSISMTHLERKAINEKCFELLSKFQILSR